MAAAIKYHQKKAFIVRRKGGGGPPGMAVNRSPPKMKLFSGSPNVFEHSLETESDYSAPPPPSAPSAETSTLVKLINLQNADGSWNLTPEFSSVLGKPERDIKAGNPDQNVEVSVWATVLAVIWLHTTSLDQREEWELLEGKAINWVRAKAGSSLGGLVRAGNGLLKSSVDLKVFGL